MTNREIDILADETAFIYTRLILLADEESFNRSETIKMFSTMFNEIASNINAEQYDPIDRSHLS